MSLTPEGQKLNPLPAREHELLQFIAMLGSIECSNCLGLKPSYSLFCAECWVFVPQEIRDQLVASRPYSERAVTHYKEALDHLRGLANV